MQGLTTFQYDMMSVLHRCGPLYGLKLKSNLEAGFERYGGEVNHGHLYPNLDKLVEAGLVDKSEKDARTNNYALTDAGRQALQDRVEELGGVMDA